eukprot:CAMPEP_0113302060 /NCGR_PEP_ID=MMETSP0010_2-20120614/3032_1 /TAXON_ID=216773 ORGANISM="Corethron hystrix, Strain 308" /NCGR_SAMPLE_ID=MMETSP0010_2 /ASSEMBLY_ACC=CAM_ASM_000155 /LENGTH=163 /DNA_ID=CAMNT_0000155791 /DNA_START=339 /DNA_END=830 /DNA_ORIENTATION=- /assembly_acc=CAM_ASM_000155
MSLVSLGSSLFTICSGNAFLDYPLEWDASRISAAIPSGVGFLGAGLIWKQTHTDEETGEATQIVKGLTTAASVWLSAAVGIACGGGLYFASIFGTSLMLLMLRFGPRVRDIDDSDSEDSSVHNRNSDLENLSGYGAVLQQDPTSPAQKRVSRRLSSVKAYFGD